MNLATALNKISEHPVVMRHLPIRDGDNITGYIDLAQERAYVYEAHKPSKTIKMPGDDPRVEDARYSLMETLADYGTVSYFGLGVFTTGIFRTWFGLGDSTAAAKLAAILLLFVFALIVIERWSRHRAQYHHTTNRYRQLPQFRLTGFRALFAFVGCLLPLLFGFLVF